MEDFYSILEVTRYYTIEQIKESYRRLALRLHPDKNTNFNATAQFQQLGRAWETLKDPSKRRTYDLQRDTEFLRKREAAISAENARRADQQAAAEKKRKATEAAKAHPEHLRNTAAFANQNFKASEQEAAAEQPRKGSGWGQSYAEQKQRQAQEAAEAEKKHRKDAAVAMAAEKLKEAQEEYRKFKEQLNARDQRPRPDFSGMYGAYRTSYCESGNRQEGPPKSFEDARKLKENYLRVRILDWKRKTASEYASRVRVWECYRTSVFMRVSDVKAQISRLEIIVTDWKTQFDGHVKSSMEYYLSIMKLEGTTVPDEALLEQAQNNARRLMGTLIHSKNPISTTTQQKKIKNVNKSLLHRASFRVTTANHCPPKSILLSILLSKWKNGTQ